MHPVLFEISGRSVGTFGTLVAIGFLLAAQLLWPALLRRFGTDPVGDPARSAIVALWVLVGLLLGGRLAFAGVEIARYMAGASGPDSLGAEFLAAPWTALDPRGGGMVMYGGLAGALLFGAIATRRSGLARARAFDTGLVAGFVGQSVGRVGCLMVGDDHGSAVPQGFDWLPFPIAYRIPDALWLEAHPHSLFQRDLAGQVVWATQTWLSLGVLALAWLGYTLLRRGARPGIPALVMLCAYGVMRFLVEYFRGDVVRGVWFDGALSTSQIVSLPLAIGCGCALFLRRSRS